MELQYYGANCVKLSTKKANVVVDDNLKDLGLSSVTKSGDIALFTSAHGEAASGVKLSIDSPGEYEVSDISITAISARAHIDEEKQKTATVFRVVIDDVRIAVLGHIYPDLSEQQLEAIGMVDVLIIPVGGNGFTLDPIGALKMIKKIEPKIVIPTHYHDDKINYPVPQQPLEDVLKGLSMEPAETTGKFKIKPAELTDTTQLIILERQ